MHVLLSVLVLLCVASAPLPAGAEEPSEASVAESAKGQALLAELRRFDIELGERLTLDLAEQLELDAAEALVSVGSMTCRDLAGPDLDCTFTARAP